MLFNVGFIIIYLIFSSKDNVLLKNTQTVPFCLLIDTEKLICDYALYSQEIEVTLR